jgi:integrase
MNFRDILFKDYAEMLDLKESLGYSRVTYQPHIRKFLSYCAENYSEATAITRSMFENWLQLQDFKTKATHNSAVSRVREYARFQAAMGKETFIPDERYSVKNVRYTPYILSDEEIRRLFHAFDTLTPHFEAPKREIIVPVLFRMMYCCGMRPQEPLNLLCKDVDLRNGDLFSFPRIG